MGYKYVKCKQKMLGDNFVYNIGVCDDEKYTCAELENMIYSYADSVGIKVEVGVWYEGEELSKYLSRGNRLDILFLDIQLISTDGISIGNFIRSVLEDMETIIIFISSKSSYAMSLFKIQPLDFLIKPLNDKIVKDTLEKAIRVYESKNQTFEYYSKGYFFKIPYNKIIYFYSQNKKIVIVLKDKELSFNAKLKEIATRVPHNFVMIHQSYLINLDYVQECSYEIVKMNDGSYLNISQPYRKKVRERIIKNYKWGR